MEFRKCGQQLLYYMLVWSIVSAILFYLSINFRPNPPGSRYFQRAEDRKKTLTEYDISCPASPEIALNSSTRRILHELPSNYLQHLKVPRTYPECGSIFPWRLESANKSGEQDERGASNLWFLIMVKSAPQYVRNRNAIRNTWGNIEALEGRLIRTVFVVARPGNDSNKQEVLVQENEMFGDLLQCNFIDSYKALPLKVLSTFAWVIGKNVNAKFYVMTDDDLILKVDKVHEFLSQKEAHAQEPRIYCGFKFNRGARPFRNPQNKWYVDKVTYPGNKYPDYCSGGMYSLTQPMIKSILCVAIVTPYSEDFDLEDLLITGILRELLNQGSSNIENGGSLVEYFNGQRAKANIMLSEGWRKMLADRDSKPSSLKALLQSNGSRTQSMMTDHKIEDLEQAWDKFT